jgi:hypothetical protein
MSENKPVQQLRWVPPFLVFAVVFLVILAVAELRQTSKMRAQEVAEANAKMQQLIEQAKKDTTDPCTFTFFRIVNPPEKSTIPKTVVVAGKVANQGDEQFYWITGEADKAKIWYGTTDPIPAQLLVSKKNALCTH